MEKERHDCQPPEEPPPSQRWTCPDCGEKHRYEGWKQSHDFNSGQSFEKKGTWVREEP
ncbi:MAG: hypothetical protein WD757_04495 [Actinomycetota bacterium]